MSLTTGRIKKILTERKLLQRDLAEHIKVPEKTLSGWLRNNRDVPPDLLVPIANFLDVTVMDLLTDDADKKNPLTDDRQGALVRALQEIDAVNDEGNLTVKGRQIVTSWLTNNAEMLKKLMNSDD